MELLSVSYLWGGKGEISDSHCFPLLSYGVPAMEGTSTSSRPSQPTGFGVLPTDAPPVGSTNQNRTNDVPLAVGLTLCLLALVIAVLGSIFYLYRRRGLGADSPRRIPRFSIQRPSEKTSRPAINLTAHQQAPP